MVPAALILDFTEVVNGSFIMYPGLTLLSMYWDFLQLDAKPSSNTICQGCYSNKTYKALLMHTQLVHLLILPSLVYSHLQSGVMVNNVTALTILETTIIYLLPPRLIGFTFSPDDGNITLTFDQEVFADDTKLTRQNHMTAPNARYTYQNQFTTNSN